MTGFWEAVLQERIQRKEEAEHALQNMSASRCRICHVPDSFSFDCIAITAPNPRAADAYLDELVHRIDGKRSKQILVLAVSDPEGVRIGSGGGTLNAILEVSSGPTIINFSLHLR